MATNAQALANQALANQALANKANAQLSTGPKSEAGKSRSSLNSLRHGLTAAAVVLPSESIEAYGRFSAAILADLSPSGILEQQLAQTIVDTHWRLNRVSALETNLLALGQVEPAPDYLAVIEDPSVRAALLEANVLIAHERQLRNLHLQEQRLHRVLRRATDDLGNLQVARFAKEARAQASEAAQTKQLLKNGFDFTALPATPPSTSKSNPPQPKSSLIHPSSRHAESTF